MLSFINFLLYFIGEKILLSETDSEKFREPSSQSRCPLQFLQHNTEIDLSERFGIPKDPLIMGVTWVRFPLPAPILFVIPFMIGEVFGSRVLRWRLWVI